MEDASNQQRDLIIMDDMMICAEVIFQDGEIPFERFMFGNLDELKNVLSDQFLTEQAAEKKASSATVQNIYFKGKMMNGVWRTELRIGNQSKIDMESLILKEEER